MTNLVVYIVHLEDPFVLKMVLRYLTFLCKCGHLYQTLKINFYLYLTCFHNLRFLLPKISWAVTQTEVQKCAKRLISIIDPLSVWRLNLNVTVTEHSI